MGSIALTTPLPVVPGTIDDAQEIGALSVRPQVTAMRIAPSTPDGPLVYVEERPIWVSWELRSVDDGRTPPLEWWRFEVQVSTKPPAVVQPRHHLVVARYPYSHTWVQYVPFKRALREERPDLRHHTLHSRAEVVAWIEAQPYDFWEKGNYLTAGVSAPEPSFESLEDIRNRHENLWWVFGVCVDANVYENTLWESKEVQQWLQQTQQGTFSFSRFYAGQRQTLPVRDDEMQGEAPKLMWLAIRQALAGPSPDKPSPQWLGRPVTEMVQYLYGDHLTLLDQRLRREREHLREIERVVEHYRPTIERNVRSHPSAPRGTEEDTAP